MGPMRLSCLHERDGLVAMSVGYFSLLVLSFFFHLEAIVHITVVEV